MRFAKIDKFGIDELLLDRGNYRFKEAPDQKACIEKIYAANPQYFKGLMKSIAEDDLGELLLVYCQGKKNIVLDGNRRLSALKVLHSDKYAPAESIKDYAKSLRKTNKISFSRIQAQVSDDKNLLLKTVYERHAGGKSGKARINWSAFAAARFRYNEDVVEDKSDWKATALVLKAEEKNPSITDFLNSPAYSHETFRRLANAAFDKGVISENIFSERDQKIRKNTSKDILSDAIVKANKFLLSLRNKEISLSRKGDGYADKERVETYLSHFSLSPDNQRLESARGNEKSTQSHEEGHGETGGRGEGATTGGSSSKNNGGPTDTGSKDEESEKNGGHGIACSSNIEGKLKNLNSVKLSGLYNSLCMVSLRRHPQLIYAGAWCFLECLSAHMGKDDEANFLSFLNGRMNSWKTPRKEKKDYELSLKDIMDKGNANKHSARYASTDASQLKQDFVVLEPLILKALDELIASKKS
jgi:hypothetical protein